MRTSAGISNRQSKIKVGSTIVLWLTWFLFDFAWMSARFHWLLNSEDADFETMKTSDDEYIWIGPKFTYSNSNQREDLGCDGYVMCVCVYEKI